MIFDTLDITDLVLLGTLALLFLVQLVWYAYILCAPARKARKVRGLEVRELEDHVGVSVILCAHNEAYNLSQYLQALLTQDYPEYEVIIVDNGSEDATREIIESYQVRDPRLRRTFVPIGARIRSTRQLALTLAAKAAKYDYLLFTEADSVPESAHWISAMMAGFRDVQGDNVQGTKDVVLGLNTYFAEESHLNRLIRYDAFFNALRNLGSALCGHPYESSGRNMAMRKLFFFESGCLAHVTLTRANTTAIVTRDAVTWSRTTPSMKDWLLEKQWRVSTESVARVFFYILTVALVVLYGIHLVSLAAIGLFLLRWLLQTAAINISARRMGVRRFHMGSILWFDIALPVLSITKLVNRKYK